MPASTSTDRLSGDMLDDAPRTGDRMFRRFRTLALLVLLALFLAACASDAPQDTLEPAGPQAETIDNLFQPVLLIAGVVFVFTQLGVVWLGFKFRRRKDDDGSLPTQTHGHTKLELGWTILPAVVLAFVAVFTVATILDLAVEDEDGLTVQVIGQQWWWEYQYDLDGDGETDITTANDLVIPAGEDVNLRITSRDVVHSFWIPRLNGKKDAVPNRVHPLVINADEPGEYVGQCTEFCGLSHAYMRQRAVALEPGEFDAWVENQLEEAVEPETEAQQRGQEIFAGQCVTCHQIRGVNELERAQQVSGAAPDLTHFASRGVFAGAVYDLYRDTDDDGFPDIEDGNFNVTDLEAWLRNPPGQKPMAPDENRGMPNLNLSEGDIDDLVAYLTSLK